MSGNPVLDQRAVRLRRQLPLPDANIVPNEGFPTENRLVQLDLLHTGRRHAAGAGIALVGGEVGNQPRHMHVGPHLHLDLYRLVRHWVERRDPVIVANAGDGVPAGVQQTLFICFDAAKDKVGHYGSRWFRRVIAACRSRRFFRHVSVPCVGSNPNRKTSRTGQCARACSLQQSISP